LGFGNEASTSSGVIPLCKAACLRSSIRNVLTRSSGSDDLVGGEVEEVSGVGESSIRIVNTGNNGGRQEVISEVMVIGYNRGLTGILLQVNIRLPLGALYS